MGIALFSLSFFFFFPQHLLWLSALRVCACETSLFVAEDARLCFGGVFLYPRSWPSIFVRRLLHCFPSASYACYCTYGMCGSKEGGLQMHSVGRLAGSCVTWDGACVVVIFYFFVSECSPYRTFVAGCSLSTTSCGPFCLFSASFFGLCM